MLQVAKIVIYVSLFSVLIPLYLFLKKKQNFSITPIKVLGLLLFASAFSDLGSYITIKMGKSNIPIVNIYILIEFSLLIYIYHFIINYKKIIYIALILFISFFVINTIFIQSINEFQNWPLLLESVLLLIISIIYYHQLLKIRIDLLRSSSFWLNTAVYFYFAFDLFLFAISNYIFKNMTADMGMISWSFHNINNIIRNILFMVAICYAGVKQQEIKPG